MYSAYFWPTLAILAGATATVTTVQNPTTRSALYWLVLSPIALGLMTVYCITGIR